MPVHGHRDLSCCVARDLADCMRRHLQVTGVDGRCRRPSVRSIAVLAGNQAPTLESKDSHTMTIAQNRTLNYCSEPTD